jgi:hypothetical protein
MHTHTTQVEVVTGGSPGAGTDADISLVLSGDKGDTPAMALAASSWGAHFDVGSTDSFEVAGVDVGTLRAATLHVVSVRGLRRNWGGFVYNFLELPLSEACYNDVFD